MIYLLVSHSNNCYANAPQCYVYTSTALFVYNAACRNWYLNMQVHLSQKSCLKAVNARRPSGLSRSQRWVQKVLDTLLYLSEQVRAYRLHILLPSIANNNCHFQGLLSLFTFFPSSLQISLFFFSSHFFLLHNFLSSPLTKRPLPWVPITFALSQPHSWPSEVQSYTGLNLVLWRGGAVTSRTSANIKLHCITSHNTVNLILFNNHKVAILRLY